MALSTGSLRIAFVARQPAFAFRGALERIALGPAGHAVVVLHAHQAPRSSRTMSFSPLAAVATTGALAVGCVRMRRRSERTERVSDDGGGASRFFPLRRNQKRQQREEITPRMITIVSPRVWRV